jgi:hypothetical protein
MGSPASILRAVWILALIVSALFWPGRSLANPPRETAGVPPLAAIEAASANGSRAVADILTPRARQTFNSPSGPFQVHFYMNPATGEPFYGLDYKAIFNGERGPTYFLPFSGRAP